MFAKQQYSQQMNAIENDEMVASINKIQVNALSIQANLTVNTSFNKRQNAFSHIMH